MRRPPPVARVAFLAGRDKKHTSFPDNDIAIWVSTQKYGKTPHIINFNRVFHYFHHPFWGTPIFGNTHIAIFCVFFSPSFFVAGIHITLKLGGRVVSHLVFFQAFPKRFIARTNDPWIGKRVITIFHQVTRTANSVCSPKTNVQG